MLATPTPTRRDRLRLSCLFAAGGPTDVIARLLSERMGAAFGQTVLIENVTGASGTIAGMRVARAAPDATPSALAPGERTFSTVQLNIAAFPNLAPGMISLALRPIFRKAE